MSIEKPGTAYLPNTRIHQLDRYQCMVYRIVHVASGRIYLSISAQWPKHRNQILRLLKLGTFTNKTLQDLYNQDPALKFSTIPTDTRVCAEALCQKHVEKLERERPGVLIPVNEYTPERRDQLRTLMTEMQKRTHENYRAGLIPDTRGTHAVRPVCIEGVYYESMSKAGLALGVSHTWVWKRVHSTDAKDADWKLA